MHIILAIAVLVLGQSAMAKSINCYGANEYGAYYQIIDVTGTVATRLISSIPDSYDPGKVTVVSDQTVSFLPDGLEDVEMGPIEINSSPTTIALFPRYTYTYEDIEGTATMSVILGIGENQNEDVMGFRGKLVNRIPGSIANDIYLRCMQK
jgi:hypothetical protein